MMNVTDEMVKAGAEHLRNQSNREFLSSTDLARLVIEAALSAAPQEPVAWLPTKTVEWLQDYEGSAVGRDTVAYRKPIKTDGGVPVYLLPVSTPVPAIDAEGVRNHLPLRRVDAEDYAEIFDKHGEKVALTIRPDLIMALNTLAASPTPPEGEGK